MAQHNQYLQHQSPPSGSRPDTTGHWSMNNPLPSAASGGNFEEEKHGNADQPVPVRRSAPPNRPPPPPGKARAPPHPNDGMDIPLGQAASSSSSSSSPDSARPMTAPAAASAQPQKKTGGGGLESGGNQHEFKGDYPLQFTLWGHNLAYGSAFLLFLCGIFTIAWSDAETYGCMLDGDPIDSTFLKGPDCILDKCCDLAKGKEDLDLNGSVWAGRYATILSVIIVLFENINWGYGLWYPSNSWAYETSVPLRGIVYFLAGFPALVGYPNTLAGVCTIITGFVVGYGEVRKEAGDGGRADRKRQAEKKRQAAEKAGGGGGGILQFWDSGNRGDDDEGSRRRCFVPTPYRIYKFVRKLYDEDRLTTWIWVTLFCLSNLILFFWTLDFWIDSIRDQRQGLKDGSLDVLCNSYDCKINRKIVLYGPISRWGPWAKACGNCLNYTCSLILLPVIKLLLKRIANAGTSFNQLQRKQSIFARFCARPITRYIPLSKNIAFHKLISFFVFGYGAGHTLFHFINFKYASQISLERFEKWGWGGTAIFTGAAIVFAMFFIYTAAQNKVKHANYEIFFFSHHWFTVFFFFLLIHGPVFWCWSLLPITLYVIERIEERTKGRKPYFVNRVEWIEPVLAVQFCPERRSDMDFCEGQYVMLNCPAISPSEWHPFTISSARDDLFHGPRIDLQTGEEVYPVPRPDTLDKREKWNKFCHISKNWRDVDKYDLLDKHETGFNDYISVHIKVHGLEDSFARSWTRKFKEYMESMNPMASYPLYFNHRDERGEVQVGRLLGPNGEQMLCVDGPHSAPSEHYQNYKTVMVIGAGIGMTPCASILSALTKFRWKRGEDPEILHFYWVVRSGDVDAFQWFTHLLTDLEYELKRGRETGMIDDRYYAEINIYVTSYKGTREVTPLKQGAREFSEAFSRPEFTANELHAALMNPTVPAKEQIERQESGDCPNRLQDIFVWNGRPDWDGIFGKLARDRQHPDIGVCFCGSPIVGKDLKAMVRKHSNAKDQILFSLHKENF